MQACDLSPGEIEAGEQEFKVILEYIARSRLTWATGDHISKNQNSDD